MSVDIYRYVYICLIIYKVSSNFSLVKFRQKNEHKNTFNIPLSALKSTYVRNLKKAKHHFYLALTHAQALIRLNTKTHTCKYANICVYIYTYAFI